MSARSNVIQLMRSIAEAAWVSLCFGFISHCMISLRHFSCCCPAHARSVGSLNSLQGEKRSTTLNQSGMEKEYAFEVSKSLSKTVLMWEMVIIGRIAKRWATTPLVDKAKVWFMTSLGSLLSSVGEQWANVLYLRVHGSKNTRYIWWS